MIKDRQKLIHGNLEEFLNFIWIKLLAFPFSGGTKGSKVLPKIARPFAVSKGNLENFV